MDSADPRIDTLRSGVADAMNRAIAEATLLVQREAVRNAPRSPTQSQIDAAKKLSKRVRMEMRSANSFSRPKPGGLERSIQQEFTKASSWENSEGSIFVLAESEAGKYAKRIHDEKHKTWHKRGLGTIAKGDRADEKFIERAIEENHEKIYNSFADALSKAVDQYAQG